MADMTIFALTVKTALATDELEVQATGGGASNKVTAASLFAANNGATLGANTFTALQTITQASTNAGVLASTGYSLTGSDATNMIDLAGTWNTSGAPTALKINITTTAASVGSSLINVLRSGTSYFRVDYAGNISGNGQTNIGDPLVTASLARIGTFLQLGGTDLILSRSAAATLQQGAADVAGSPVAQFTRVQSASGVANTAGANWTFQASAGTGSANGGSLIFQVAPLAGSGSTKNAYATALTIDSTKLATFAGNITKLGGAVLLTTSSALTDGAAAQVGTLTTAPLAGNPTKWIGINDNGTTRYIPAW